MERRKILVIIILLLLFAICGYLFYVRFDDLVEFYKLLLDDVIEKEVIIPETNEYSKKYDFDTFKNTTNFRPQSHDDVKDIFYTALNNGWDKFTFYCPDEYTNCAYDVKKIANESDFITTINNYVHPFNSYKKINTFITGEDEVLIEIEKLYTNEEINLLNKMIDDIIIELKINKDNITVEDIKKIHDYIASVTTYDDNYDKNDTTTISNKANGALVNKVALCSGYTDAFALFMDKLGVMNFKVSTDTHVWNAIYFEGEWSHIDITWDDDEVNENNTYNFFMISTEDMQKLDISEHYFNQQLYSEIN